MCPISTFISWNCLKGTLVQQKNEIRNLDLLACWKKFHLENFKFDRLVSSNKEVAWAKFDQSVLCNREIACAKNEHSSFLSWLSRRFVESFSKIWIVVSNSAYQKIFLKANEKVKISNIIGWFCLKEKLP